jgi:hypothetical protein
VTAAAVLVGCVWRRFCQSNQVVGGAGAVGTRQQVPEVRHGDLVDRVAQHGDVVRGGVGAGCRTATLVHPGVCPALKS